MKRCQKLGRALPPPYLDKIQKNSSFFRDVFPQYKLFLICLSICSWRKWGPLQGCGKILKSILFVNSVQCNPFSLFTVEYTDLRNAISKGFLSDPGQIPPLFITDLHSLIQVTNTKPVIAVELSLMFRLITSERIVGTISTRRSLAE